MGEKIFWMKGFEWVKNFHCDGKSRVAKGRKTQFEDWKHFICEYLPREGTKNFLAVLSYPMMTLPRRLPHLGERWDWEACEASGEMQAARKARKRA